MGAHRDGVGSGALAMPGSSSSGGRADKKLADAVRRLRANDAGLTKLDLTYEVIGDEGAKALAEALRGNTGLRELDLWGNGIGDAGAAALAEALRGNTGLTELGLDFNDIGDAVQDEIDEALAANQARRDADERRAAAVAAARGDGVCGRRRGRRPAPRLRVRRGARH